MWFGHQDANGAWFSVAARNWQLHGFFSLGGIIDTNSDLLGAVEPYTHHPPLAVWLADLPTLIFGYNEALLRFAMTCCTLIGIAVLIVSALPSTVYYLRELYSGSDDASGLAFAQVVDEQTTPHDLILSNVPTVGMAVEFYAERQIVWQPSPDQAAALASRFDGATYYAVCGDLPLPVTPLAEVQINPPCRLDRLR